MDEVADVTRQPFKELWEMNIYEFFAYASYSRWKAKQQADSIKKWQQTNYVR